MKLEKRVFRKPIIRNKEYIKNTLEPISILSPITTREMLYERILGKKTSKESKKIISDIINSSIDPIKDFIDQNIVNDNSNTLVIDSQWGSGKTTSLLIAISESTNTNNRYIYESVFKYSNDMNEFFVDFFHAIDEILQENKIYTHNITDDLLENIGNSVNFKNIYSQFFKSKNNYLSTDIIHKLNDLYKENKKAPFNIIVIIDDLDRLNGDDITKVLSVLSMLRKTTFIKIILPIDKQVVIDSLGNSETVQPELFIEKYLPEQSCIKIKSGYFLASLVMDGVIKRSHKNLKSIDVSPAIYAISIKILSDRFHELTKDWSYNTDKRWLNPNAPNTKEFEGQIKTLVSIPAFIYDRKESFHYSNNSHLYKYEWQNYDFDPRKIENVILRISRANSTSNFIKNRFTDDDYNETIKSWVFEYMTRYWDTLGLTIRHCTNIADILSETKFSEKPAEQFTQAYNILFSDSKINYDNGKDTPYSS